MNEFFGRLIRFVVVVSILAVALPAVASTTPVDPPLGDEVLFTGAYIGTLTYVEFDAADYGAAAEPVRQRSFRFERPCPTCDYAAFIQVSDGEIETTAVWNGDTLIFERYVASDWNFWVEEGDPLYEVVACTFGVTTTYTMRPTSTDVINGTLVATAIEGGAVEEYRTLIFQHPEAVGGRCSVASGIMTIEMTLDPTSVPATTTTTMATTTTTAAPATTVPPTTTVTAPPTTVTTVLAAPATESEVLGMPAMATSIRPPSDISTEPVVVGFNLLLALVLVLLMPFPAELFNRTLDEHYDRVVAGVERFVPGRRSSRIAPDERERRRSSRRTLVGVTLAGGLLAGFLDPEFGFDRRSAALFVGGLAAVASLMGLSTWLAARYATRRHPGVAIAARALPGALLVGIACVILSRAIGFQPGYLYGVLAGVAVGATLSVVEEGRSAALTAAAMGVLSLVAWMGWTALQPSIGVDPGFGLVVLNTFLAALFVAGLEGMAFGLAPMRFLSGAQVMKWSRTAWAAMFGLGIFAVLHLLAHPGAGYGPTESAVPFSTVLALFVGFGMLSVAFWAWFRYRPAGEPEAELRVPVTEPL